MGYTHQMCWPEFYQLLLLQPYALPILQMGKQNQASLSHLPKAILVQQLLYSNNYSRGNLWREITEIEMLFLDEYLK